MQRGSSAVWGGVAIALVMVVGASAQNLGGSAEARKLKNPVAASPVSVAAGKATYEKNCRFCHGTDAQGNGQMAPKDVHPSNLVGAAWDRGATDGEIFAVLRDGAGPDFKMKGYESRMSEADMWNVVNYLRSLGPQAKK